jgi:hypothetical protein
MLIRTLKAPSLPRQSGAGNRLVDICSRLSHLPSHHYTSPLLPAYKAPLSSPLAYASLPVLHTLSNFVVPSQGHMGRVLASTHLDYHLWMTGPAWVGQQCNWHSVVTSHLISSREQSAAALATRSRSMPSSSPTTPDHDEPAARGPPSETARS